MGESKEGLTLTAVGDLLGKSVIKNLLSNMKPHMMCPYTCTGPKLFGSAGHLIPCW
jgi:hypothetical protein